MARLEADTGVDRYMLLGVWGMETVFGNVVDDMKYMRPVLPALAARRSPGASRAGASTGSRNCSTPW
jgi:membrane-bound lytic murein transglycosylase B